VLLAFINSSGPTHKPQELPILLSDNVFISVNKSTRSLSRRRLRVTFNVGPVLCQA